MLQSKKLNQKSKKKKFNFYEIRRQSIIFILYLVLYDIKKIHLKWFTQTSSTNLNFDKTEKRKVNLM